MIDNDYAINMLHDTPISFNYDGNGNYTISRKDLALLLKTQHNNTLNEASKRIHELIRKDSSCVGIGYAKTCNSILVDLVEE